jgi:type IV secretion system protein VirB4
MPWAGLLGEATILNKTGELCSVIAYRGLDLESASKGEQLVACARVNNLLRRLTGGWTIQVEMWRRPFSGYLTPAGALPAHPVAGLFDVERRAAFEDGRTHFESRYYLTLTYRTPTDRRNKLMSLLWENLPEDEVHYGGVRQYFEDTVRRVTQALRDIFPYAELLRESALLTYLGQAATLRDVTVGMPEVPLYLDAQLATEDLHPGVRPQLGSHHLRALTIRLFPGSVWPGMLAALETLEFPCRFAQRWIAMDAAFAARQWRKYERRWLGKRKGLLTLLREEVLKTQSTMSDPDAEENAADARAAQLEVQSGDVAYGYYTGTAVVWDEDPKRAAEKIAHVARELEARGVTVHIEDLNMVEAWAGTMPGNVYANVRMPPLNSANLARVIPTNAIWTGPARCEHLKGPALMQASSIDGTPFRVSLHQGDVGDTLLIGPKGSGKSTLLNCIELQFFERYPGAQVFIFEQGMSAKVVTHCMGGKWYALGGEGGLGLQPLVHVDDHDERVWALDWLETITTQEKVEMSPERKSELWGALTSLATMPQEHRTVSGLMALVQDVSLREALRPYTIGGAYGFLDANEDHLSSGRWQCFELKYLMDMPAAAAPTLFALFHRLEQWLTGAPTIIPIDEAWLALSHPAFVSRLRLWIKTLRKLNASVIFATQNLADVVDSPLAAAIAQECMTRLFLPNQRAMEPQIRRLYEAFGLSSRQIEVIALGTPKRNFYYQSPAGNRLAELNLGHVGVALAGSGSPEDLTLLDTLLEEGEEDFAGRWFEAKGLPWAAELLRENPDYAPLDIERTAPVIYN